MCGIADPFGGANRYRRDAFVSAMFASIPKSLLEQEGYIRADAVRNRLQQWTEKDPVPMQLWYLYGLETWIRHEYAAVEKPVEVFQ